MSVGNSVDISLALAGKVPLGTPVTVRGWVRTRRDSKAGVSFIHLHDGSCFEPIQVVAPKELPNYDSEVQKLTTGCAVVARGSLTASQGKGQSVELLADSVEVLGWVDDPDHYRKVEDFPVQKKVHSLAVDTETHRVYTPEQEADGKGVARMVVYEAVTSK